MKIHNEIEEMKQLAVLVKAIEVENKLEYPNLLGGRTINKLADKKLTLDEWTSFNHYYNLLSSKEEFL